MESYKKIILAVELSPETDAKPIARAVDLAKKTGASITLVHGIEHISAYGGTYGIAISTDIESSLLKSASEEMHKLGKKLGVPDEHCIVKFGLAKVIILEEAEKRKTDLIIVGSHGRHGVQILLGSTANAVLHGAKCDVLAVRIK